MEENNVHKGGMDADGDYDGYPSQAHADHAHIMKAHEILKDPHRMAGVHALHKDSQDMMSFYKQKQKDLATKEAQQKIGEAPAHEETAEADHDANMEPNPSMAAGKKMSKKMG